MFQVNQAKVYVLGQPGGILYMFQDNQVVLDVLVNQAEVYVLGQPGSIYIIFQVNQAAVVLMRSLITFHRDQAHPKIALM